MAPAIFTAAIMAAFITGLASSLHCLGMCGGAMSAMMLVAKPSRTKRSVDDAIAVFPLAALAATIASSRLPRLPRSQSQATRESAAIQHLPLVLAFNGGRMLSYSIAGALTGAVGGGIGELLMRDAMPIRITLFVLANMVMLLTGLYIAGWTQWLAPLERAGSTLWKIISPLTHKLLPVQSAGQAALLGALWGWIPCGLVYAMLLVGLASGNAVDGAVTMLAFGLGTLPAMTMAGALSAKLRSLLHKRQLRIAAGLTVIVIALIGLNRIPVLAGLANYATLTELCHSAVVNAVSTVRQAQ